MKERYSGVYVSVDIDRPAVQSLLIEMTGTVDNHELLIRFHSFIAVTFRRMLNCYMACLSSKICADLYSSKKLTSSNIKAT